MSDRSKTCLSIFLTISMLVLPLIGFIVGWIAWDIKTGVIIGLVAFGVLFLASGVFLALVRFPSWFTVSLPFVTGLLYTILPDFLPGPFDDVGVMSAGAIFSYFLWLKKQPDTPRWIFWPLISVGIYTLIGGFIPGPIDELLVATAATAIAATSLLKKQEELSEEPPAAGSTDEVEVIDGAFLDEEAQAVGDVSSVFEQQDTAASYQFDDLPEEDSPRVIERRDMSDDGSEEAPTASS